MTRSLVDLSVMDPAPAMPVVIGSADRPRIKFLMDREDRDWVSEAGCWICGSTDPLAVDHDHVAGFVRGFLCRGCNVGLGSFRDDPHRLIRAAEYLTTAAARAFSDMCSRCDQSKGPAALVVDPADPRRRITKGVYRCDCGHEWTCTWGTDAWVSFSGIELRRHLNGTRP
jgi:hypothetical protein